MKLIIDIEKDVVDFLKDNIDDITPIEQLIPKMLKLLIEILKISNDPVKGN